jgi:hypothetical protein
MSDGKVKVHARGRPSLGRPLDVGEGIASLTVEGVFTWGGGTEIRWKPGRLGLADLRNVRVLVWRVLARLANSIAYVARALLWLLLIEESHSPLPIYVIARCANIGCNLLSLL